MLSEFRLMVSGEVLTFMSSSLQGGPHFLVALVGPDYGIIDSGGLVVSARDVERQAMLVDRKARKFGVHHFPCRRHGFLEAAALGDRSFGRAVERGDEIARHRDRLAPRGDAFQRIA